MMQGINGNDFNSSVLVNVAQFPARAVHSEKTELRKTPNEMVQNGYGEEIGMDVLLANRERDTDHAAISQHRNDFTARERKQPIAITPKHVLYMSIANRPSVFSRTRQESRIA